MRGFVGFDAKRTQVGCRPNKISWTDIRILDREPLRSSDAREGSYGLTCDSLRSDQFGLQLRVEGIFYFQRRIKFLLSGLRLAPQ